MAGVLENVVDEHALGQEAQAVVTNLTRWVESLADRKRVRVMIVPGGFTAELEDKEPTCLS